jgi:hypothetical protein
MGDPHTLNTVATIERQTSVEILKKLLSEAVGPEELIPYAEAFGNQPRLVPLGDLTDALERIGTDHAASETFAVSVMCGALVKVASAQQRRIEDLEEQLASEAEPKPKSTTKK